MRYIHNLKTWYEKYEGRVSSLSLIGGFIFDTFTLSRVDALRDNLWVAVNLIIVSICIILLNKKETNSKKTARRHFWLVTILQFAFGTLIGTFVIFYFRSASLAVSWPFLLILIFALVANEYLKKHYDRLLFQISFLFFSIFLFSIFIIPVILHQIGSMIFLLSGLVSLVLLYFFLSVFNKFSGDKLKGHRLSLQLSILTIFGFINILYFTNLIPPIPLSLKDAGVYHSLSRDSGGNYLVGYEDHGWRGLVTLYPNFHLTSSQVVYAYSAIFSPASFKTGIIHEWQHFDNVNNKWTTESKIDLSVFGGRDRGYRTYSTLINLAEGHWRVNVLTSTGQVLGRLRFNILHTTVEPLLTLDTKL